ncbi:hypothetical protein B0H13DRAFT_2387542 [Mycena leptocephala]|nr:hypothetical protein B0H13DRAFT_2387542 [Mycena leptocephala]
MSSPPEAAVEDRTPSESTSLQALPTLAPSPHLSNADRPETSPLLSAPSPFSQPSHQLWRPQQDNYYVHGGMGRANHVLEGRTVVMKAFFVSDRSKWEQYLSNPDLHELADFAMLLLGLVVNQGGNEHDFSDFKIKKTRRRNRLGVKKVGEMAKASPSAHTFT